MRKPSLFGEVDYRNNNTAKSSDLLCTDLHKTIIVAQKRTCGHPIEAAIYNVFCLFLFLHDSIFVSWFFKIQNHETKFPQIVIIYRTEHPGCFGSVGFDLWGDFSCKSLGSSQILSNPGFHGDKDGLLIKIGLLVARLLGLYRADIRRAGWPPERSVRLGTAMHWWMNNSERMTNLHRFSLWTLL